jgi:putative transport protein
MTQLVKPKFPAKAQRFHMGEISIGAKPLGHTLDDLSKEVLSDVQVTMVRKGGQNIVPPAIRSCPLATRFVVAEREEAIANAAAKLGKLEPGRLASDHADLDYIRFCRKAGVGVPSRVCRCHQDIRRIFFTSGATTPTSCRHPT